MTNNKRQQRPLLLNICVSGVIIILSFMLAADLLLLFNINSYVELQTIFSSKNSAPNILDHVVIALGFLLSFLYASVQILRRKIHAAYIFHFLSVLLLPLLVFYGSVEWVNLLMLLLINLVVFFNYHWFKHTIEDFDDENQQRLSES